MDQYRVNLEGLAEIHSETDLSNYNRLSSGAEAFNCPRFHLRHTECGLKSNVVVDSRDGKGGVEILEKCSFAIIMEISGCLKTS